MNSNKHNIPLVSVPVITYNSAKTVLETLESIKAQTYPNIELIISDDCSTDNTVEICREWLEQNKDRFVRTEILTVEQNTGVAGNLNRAEAACQGEWVKPIAGDDLLLPNCVQDCMDYVAEHPETIILFGQAKAFGADKELCEQWDKKIDNKALTLTAEQLLHDLLFEGNCISAAGYFFNRTLLREYQIKNDECIPMLEDWPKWINALRAGISFYPLDKVIVKYRVSNGISTGKRSSLKYFESERLMRFYYLYPEWQKEDVDAAVKRIVKEECDIYQQLLESESDTETSLRKERNFYKGQYEIYSKWYNQIFHSKAYRIGKAILKPLKWLKKK